VDVCFPVQVIPVNGESDIFCCLPVHRHRIIFFDCANQMVCIFLSDIFYCKVVDTEAETYGFRLVSPKSVYDFALMISKLC
jgi:hypothetical protein